MNNFEQFSHILHFLYVSNRVLLYHFMTIKLMLHLHNLYSFSDLRVFFYTVALVKLYRINSLNFNNYKMSLNYINVLNVS